jgi:hypothetical protein
MQTRRCQTLRYQVEGLDLQPTEDIEMDTKHTPGPWRQARNCTNAVVCDSPTGHNDDGNVRYYGGYLVAESIFEPANARLIAAAPLLLEALAVFVDFPADTFDGDSDGAFTMTVRLSDMRAARAAIAAATN